MKDSNQYNKVLSSEELMHQKPLETLQAEGSVPPDPCGASDRSNHWDRLLPRPQIGAGMASALASVLWSQISLCQSSITS